MNHTCKICAAETNPAFSHKLLNKYDVQYFSCGKCGALQTETPHWFDEAYSDAIAITDTGILARNILISKRVTNVLSRLFDEQGKYLDIAGGYGVLTRMMRDIGFNFSWSDPYCSNLFAKGFEELPDDKFSAVTAFEVMEHLEDPKSFLSEAFSKSESRTVIFTTELFSDTPPELDWWYYSFETGQHIFFYQKKTLQYLADYFNTNYYTIGSFHIFTTQEYSAKQLNSDAGKYANLRYLLNQRKHLPLTFHDHELLKKHIS